MTFKPMLAATASDKALEKLLAQTPLIASPKLDGIRGVVRDGVLLSRSLKPIPNPFVQARFGRPEYEGLDGELILGDPTAEDVYRVTNGACMRKTGEPDVKFWVFDSPGDEPFSKRLEITRGKVCLTDHVMVLPQFVVTDMDHLAKYEEAALGEGFEGVILRHPDAPYKHGRSTAREGGMLKVKRFSDSEAMIMGMTELMHNGNEAKTNALGQTERSSHKANKVPMNTMGTLVVRDVVTDVEFEVGTGFTQADRQWFWKYWPLGSIIKYKFFSVGVKERPRHPVYLGMRNPIDMS